MAFDPAKTLEARLKPWAVKPPLPRRALGLVKGPLYKKCFDKSAQFILDNEHLIKPLTLVHGAYRPIADMPEFETGHGWVRLPDLGLVFDGVQQAFYEEAKFLEISKARKIYEYTPAAARANMLKTGFYGPWEPIRTTFDPRGDSFRSWKGLKRNPGRPARDMTLEELEAELERLNKAAEKRYDARASKGDKTDSFRSVEHWRTQNEIDRYAEIEPWFMRKQRLAAAERVKVKRAERIATMKNPGGNYASMTAQEPLKYLVWTYIGPYQQEAVTAYSWTRLLPANHPDLSVKATDNKQEAMKFAKSEASRIKSGGIVSVDAAYGRDSFIEVARFVNGKQVSRKMIDRWDKQAWGVRNPSKENQMQCPSCNKTIGSLPNPGDYRCSGCGASVRVNPHQGKMSLAGASRNPAEPNVFIFGDVHGGYSIGRSTGAERRAEDPDATGGDLWEMRTWSDALQVRTDLYDELYEAVEYAVVRASQHYGWPWVKKHAKQYKVVIGRDVTEFNQGGWSGTSEGRSTRTRLRAEFPKTLKQFS